MPTLPFKLEYSLYPCSTCRLNHLQLLWIIALDSCRVQALSVPSFLHLLDCITEQERKEVCFLNRKRSFANNVRVSFIYSSYWLIFQSILRAAYALQTKLKYVHIWFLKGKIYLIDLFLFCPLPSFFSVSLISSLIPSYSKLPIMKEIRINLNIKYKELTLQQNR